MLKGLGLSAESVQAQTICSAGNHSSVEHCTMNGIDVIRINLNDPGITIKPVIAPNGGLASLTSLAGPQGIAAINGDYRLGSCSNGVYCGEGLTYVGGKNYTMGPSGTYNYRRSLAFNQSSDPHIGYPSEQGGSLWNVLGGGPRFTDNGAFSWKCSVNGAQNQDCPNQNGTVIINDEYFGSSATAWWNRPQSAIGFSSDGNTMYFAASAGNVTMQQLHDVLWQLGSRNNLKLDGGSARSMYYNDGSGHYLYLGQGITEPGAWVIVPNDTPSTPTPVPTTPPAAWAYQLFDLGDFNGEKYESDQTISNFTTINKNDWAESLKVNAGYGIIACVDADFHGTCARANGPAQFADLNTLAQGLRNGISSIQVCPGSCPDPTPTPMPPPGLPPLISPADGAVLSTGDDVTLVWGAASNANAYAAELWGLATPLLSGRQAGTSFHVGLLPAGDYLWKVEAYNANGDWSGWSERTFRVATPQPTPTIVPVPAPPVLVSPAAGALLSTNDDITLVWNSSANAVEYHAELWGPAGMRYSGRQPGTSWYVGKQVAGDYLWQVEAFNANGDWSGWSQRTFSVAAPPPTPTPTKTPVPPAPTATPVTPAPTATISADVIFADGFESGDFSAWSFAYTNGGRLSVSTAAAQVGSKGAQAAIASKLPVYLADDRPSAEPRYRTRFYFNPNSITMASGNAHYLLQAYNSSSTVVMRIELRRYSSNYQLRAALLNDSTTWKSSSWYTITNGWHSVEVDWAASTSSTAKSGTLTFWIDGVQKSKSTGVDNDTRRIDGLWLGPITGLDSGTQGTYYFDAFESRRQSYIGAAAAVQGIAAPEPAVTPEPTGEETDVLTTVVSTTVQPGTDGILAGDVDGVSISLKLPVNTSSKPITAMLISTDTQTAPAGYTLLGAMFDIQLRDENGLPVDVFEQPVTVSAGYTSVVEGGDQSSETSLQAWSADLDLWETVPATLNLVDNTVTAVLSRSATMALWEKEATGQHPLYLPAIQR